MATKPVTSKKITTAAIEKAPATPAAARVTKPRTPRVTSVTHSKPVLTKAAATEVVTAKKVKASAGNPQEVIAGIAYGYWEARGCTGGSPAEDWFRAEAEYSQRSR